MGLLSNTSVFTFPEHRQESILEHCVCIHMYKLGLQINCIIAVSNVHDYFFSKMLMFISRLIITCSFGWKTTKQRWEDCLKIDIRKEEE